MKQLAIINIYNFIRKSHQEPSDFIQADYDTIAKQIRILKQYGLPSTYALKYDALMDPTYQNLMLTETDENDEIGAWWEVCSALCEKAGVQFQGIASDVFDERVGSAYSPGYTPEERRKLIDAYMDDFHKIFGYYPKTLGSWILDPVTVSYAHEKYGVIGFPICRDQIGTDGFTLWGGWPNGLYFPSKDNIYVPSQTKDETIPVAMFRLLGADPILCFEQEAREGIAGVYTLEPSCYNGRDLGRISWFFSTLTDQEGAGIGYAQVGQENNFLWENIKPGFEPQVKLVKELFDNGKIRLETMEESAAWFCGKYALTPPLCWQSSVELTHKLCVGQEGVILDTQWYASRFYRLGFLAEQGHLRIRDWFLFREKYPCRYLKERIKTAASTYDALPLVFVQKWGCQQGRPFVRFMEIDNGTLKELQGKSCFWPEDEYAAHAQLETDYDIFDVTMKEESLQIIRYETVLRLSDMRYPVDKNENKPFILQFDQLPVYTGHSDKTVHLEHEGFSYDFVINKGEILFAGTNGLQIQSENGEICLKLSGESTKDSIFNPEYLKNPKVIDEWIPRWIKNPIPLEQQPLRVPEFSISDRCFDLAKGTQNILVTAIEDNANLCYTVDSKNNNPSEWVQTNTAQANFELKEDTTIQARSVMDNGRTSDTGTVTYRFSWKDLHLESNTTFDWRPFFDGRGISGLLKEERGDGDWQCGNWIATLENLDFICELPEERLISTVEVGFLTSHRAGIIYPELLELYVGEDKDHLELYDVLRLPEGSAAAEIECKDWGFAPNVRAKCIRFVAKRYDIMPQWACYKGTTGVFTMADCLIIH